MTAIQDKLRNKAFSKMSNLTTEVKDVENDIRYGISILEDEQLENILRKTKEELQIWSYIAELVEKDI
jgi:hypothetical protein